MDKIDGGATIWARQTIDSAIFYQKPDRWFKIWFYIVNRVNYRDNNRFKKGSCFLKYSWIMSATGATKDQIKHCIKFLKDSSMLATQKATRGFYVEVLKYSYYQDLKNYKSHTERHMKATQEPHSYLKKLKNVKNNTSYQKEIIYFNFNLKTWINIIPDDLNMWKSAYPACNIEIELKQMSQWLLSNPDKRKKNYRRFITNWLTRSQEKGGTKGLAKTEHISKGRPKTDKEIIAYQKKKYGWSALEQKKQSK